MTSMDPGDRRLAELAVAGGYVRTADLERAQGSLSERRAAGEEASLGAILVELGLVAPAAVRELLSALGQELLACTRAGCERRYVVREYRPDRDYRCHRCRCRLAVRGLDGPVDHDSEAGDTAERTALLTSAICHVKPRDGVTAPDPLETEATLRVGPEGPGLVGSIGRYLDVEELARGGMGAIFRGVDPDLDRTVAIKVGLFPSGESEAVRRFEREARLTGQLEHPNIVPIHELSRAADGRPYFAMKLVRGRSLADVLEDLRARPDGLVRERGALLARFLKVCDAVAFAHSHGVVHRDLKPANVMVGEFGEVLVMDWGLARHVSGEAEPRTSTRLERPETMTQTGVLLGTPAYMSPEQAEGRLDRLDATSDVYSLGAMLYEILTHTLPHRGRGLPELLREIDRGVVEPPSSRAPAARVPRELDAVVLRAMARDPGQRYAGVLDLRADIEAYLGGRALAAAEYSPLALAAKWVRRNRAVAAGVAATLLAVAAGLAGMALVRRRGEFEARERRSREARSYYDEGRADWEVAVRENPLDCAVFQEAFQARLVALSRAARGIQEDPDPPGEWKEWLARQAGELQQEAQSAGEWALAQILAELAGAWGAVEASERDRRLAGVREARAAKEARDLGELDEVLSRIRGEGHGSLIPGEVEERARRFARIEGAALTGEILARLERAPSAEAHVERAFLIEILGRRGDLVSGEPGRREPDLVRRWLERPYGEIGADERAAWILAAARLEARSGGTFEPDWIEAAFGRGREDPIPIVAQAARRAAGFLEAVRARRSLRGAARGLLEDLADWLAGRVESGSVYTRALVDRARAASGDAEAAFVYDLMGLRGDVGPALGGSPRVVLRGVLAAVPDEWLLGAPIPGVDPRARERAGGLAARAAVNLSRLGDPSLVGDLFARRFADARFWGMVRVAFRLAPMGGWPEPSSAIEFVRRGMAHQMRGDLERAIADFDRSIALDPAAADAHNGRALALRALGDVAGALDAFDRAIELAPAEASFLSNRSAARLLRGDVAGALEDADRALAIDPGLADAWNDRGNAHSSMGEMAGAVEDYGRAIELDPTHYDAWYNRGMAWSALGEVARALGDLDRALELHPSFARAYRNRGPVRQKAGDLEGAIADCDRAIALSPAESAAFHNRALARKALGDVQGAIDDLDRALELERASVRSLVARGSMRWARGDTGGAAEDFERALVLDPRCAEAYANRAAIRLAAGDVAGAHEDADRAVDLGPDDAVVWNVRAAVRYRSGDPRGAIEDSDRAIELEPGHARAWHNRGLSRRAIRDLAGAVADLDRAIALDPQMANAWYGRGLSRRDLGDVAGAAADFGEALRLDPSDPNAWYERGAARQFLGDREGAIEDYGRALELRPDHAAALANRALARRSIGDLEGALADYDRAIEVAPEMAMAYNGRAGTRRLLGDDRGAIEDFERAVRIEPRLWQAWTNRGALLAALGVRDEAARSFEEALRHAPASQRASVESIRRQSLEE